MHRPSALAAVLTALFATAAFAQQGDGTDVTVQAHVFKPAKVEATPERIAQLKVPQGFRIAAFATGLKNARILAVAPDGTVYVSRRDQGDVLMLKDTDGDGRADGPPVTVANRAGAHGLAIHDGKLYLATVKEVFVADIRPDGRLGPLTLLIGDLPDAGQHPNRTLAFGPDGMLYISAGSTCNACNESNPENATLLRATPDGKSRTIVASGLRNTIGFGWHPRTGELWGMDHGIDYLGDDAQPEELNLIERGRRYGWPHVWGGDGAQGGLNPQSTPPGELTKAQWKALSTPMVLGTTAHSAPMQMVFYAGGSFPSAYDGDAFVAMRGSWNRTPASGYEIVRIRFAPNGRPQAFEPFASGFLTDGGRTHIARPVGLAVARDGSLLMADDANGVIYRISYGGSRSGATASAKPLRPPAGPMLAQASRGVGVPLAFDRPETRLAANAAAVTAAVEAPASAPAGAVSSPAAPAARPPAGATPAAAGPSATAVSGVTPGIASVAPITPMVPAAPSTLVSPAFADGAMLPKKYSEYADGVSPPLVWQAVPGAKSYALIVEDPDAKPITPFVHWLAWNIPADVTLLPEGVQEQDRLTQPDGVLQGATSRGSVGWYGPRPPVGDPPHHYHVQWFALDTLLDVPPGADRDTLLAAMRGHVIAKARLVGRYQQTVAPPR